LRQSAQLHTNDDSKPSPCTGKASCTAPQKHVAVASSAFENPSLAWPARGKYGSDLSAVETDIAVATGEASLGSGVADIRGVWNVDVRVEVCVEALVVRVEFCVDGRGVDVDVNVADDIAEGDSA
jgi:hypothetical protein